MGAIWLIGDKKLKVWILKSSFLKKTYLDCSTPRESNLLFCLEHSTHLLWASSFIRGIRELYGVRTAPRAFRVTASIPPTLRHLGLCSGAGCEQVLLIAGAPYLPQTLTREAKNTGAKQLSPKQKREP